jgi:putative transposase
MRTHYSAAELSAALGLTRQAVCKRAASERWTFRMVDNRRGGDIKEYSLDSLPKADREKIGEYWLRIKLDSSGMKIAPCNITSPAMSHNMPEPGALKHEVGLPKSASSCLSNPATLTNTNKQVIVPERSENIGLAKFNLVGAWRELLDTQPHGRKVEAIEAFLLAYNSGRLLPNVFKKVGVIGESTLREMDKRLRASREENNGCEDYRVLADGRGGWRKHGTNLWRKRSLSNDAKDVFLSCWLRPEQPTVALAIRAARITLERRGIVEESDDRTWRRWLDDWSKRSQHIIVLAREGEKAYRDKVGPYITRDDSILEPGQVLIADGHDLNFQILHPHTGKPARLKLVMFIDWASHMPVGWQIMPTESTVVIQAALRNALMNLGKLPQVVYLDNGRAFKAKVFTDIDPDLTELTGIYGRLGIATMFAQPYNARAKIIERFFETLNEQFERLISSYTGASIADKPAWTARNEKFHRAQHAKRTGGWIPDIREAAWLVNLYIQWYGQQEHSGIHFKKPAEVLAAGRGPGLDVSELNSAFLWTKKCRTSRCRVTLFGIDYESDCLHGYAEQVLVKYDCSDLGKVWFHALSGEYLGEGLPVQALSPIARLMGDQVGVDQVKKAMERQRSLAKSTKEGLIELGTSAGMADGLTALPWREKAAVLPGGKEEAFGHEEREGGTKGAEIDQLEKARLELVVSNAEAEIRTEEARGIELERPETFATVAGRYDWLWRARFEHRGELTGEETAFMGWFETTAEYEEYRGRYEDLMLIYGE